MLHSIVIEVRRHLCCANVFLKFQECLDDVEALQIFVDETKVKLESPKKCRAEILVHYFSILAGSFSNLIVDAENASFRMSVKDIQLTEQADNPKKDFLQINLGEQDEISLMCCNCDAVLAAAQKYDKVREFPSGAIDVSEFFCHHGPNFKDVLVPSVTDLFYGFQFIVLNRATVSKSIREKENHIYCSRCLKYLGETMFNGRAVKIWSDAVCLYKNEESNEIFSSDEKSQIYKLLLKAIEETSLPSPEPLLRNIHFTKVLFKATFSNRQHQFLLVHILEKHLPVLRNIENTHSTIQSSELQETQFFQLKENRAFKILYRLIANENFGKGTTGCLPILEYWQQDINVLKMIISPSLFCALNKELDTNIIMLPKVYRLNTDDFLLSYIFY